MVEMELFRLRIDDNRGDQLVILKEKKGHRLLPIVIGMFEADAIRLKIAGVELARPFTHDLLKNTIQELGGRLHRVIIDHLDGGTFHAKMLVETSDGQKRMIDSRPSDAIAVALRAGVPIFVEEEVISLTAA